MRLSIPSGPAGSAPCSAPGAQGLQSVGGTCRTHIASVIDKPWPAVTAADCERLREALDAKRMLGTRVQDRVQRLERLDDCREGGMRPVEERQVASLERAR
jgi:hypothetical protein